MWSKELEIKVIVCCHSVNVIKTSYDIDLSHGVDENNCEDGDGQPQQEGPAQVPDDASQSEKEMINIEMIKRL